jgi:diacylglycerol O-acyltransferase
MTQLQLADLKKVKEHIGGTLNDLVLGLVATSLRSFLIEKNELPDKPLLVTVPVSREQKNTGREFGNSTAVTQTLLHVQIADPRERYEAIRASTELGKRELEIIGRDTFALLSHYVPPVLQVKQAERIYHKQLANKDKFKIPANLSVSNVPGPREKFSALGNVVEDFYSAGPVVDGMGLNITVWSYAGHMNFCLAGCMKALPDIHDIAEGFEPALKELAAMTGEPSRGDNEPEPGVALAGAS